ncbi:hypothetical protein GUITHDRAFT_156666 [Guillardia theta CCMP2712]|uniref:Uncharacterized protein n=2 Tax=Guillardia theta TaxID=55529 RepID=L1I5J6_GUITC|nr:hypothetical protein GUITHDRAFT_156666 [Guillardia theta CCMP2712]EKX31159.1 hypothetical protein GUITHDRAFT_156666 [Guillardia theta CCMP2712]|eukprot:XP_005818139.1 hypothetical protein GUITHDRAFT_156666 [Guillardia theta CCMP2712]
MSIIRDGCPQAKKTSADRGYQTVEQPSTLHLSSTDCDHGGLVGGELSAPLQLLVFFLLLLLHRKSLLLCVRKRAGIGRSPTLLRLCCQSEDLAIDLLDQRPNESLHFEKIHWTLKRIL